MELYASFAPIVFLDSKVLILGSFPSLQSVKNDFYYAHPQNQFWKLLSCVYGLPITSKQDKIKLLEHAKIALWDVVKSCTRTNSSDANLKNITPNDIAKLLADYQTIEKIYFTSKTAQKLYLQYFKDIKIDTSYLPSPSPAYAAMGFLDKLEVYKKLTH